MDLVDTAEEVVEVPHDVLVSAHKKETEVVGLDLAIAVGMERVERKGVAHVSKVNELVDLSVRIAGDIHQRGLAHGPLVEAADGQDGKQLAQRPMVQQRLEHGEITEVLVAKAVFELADFFGDVGLAL